jgi:hypothetical protein
LVCKVCCIHSCTCYGLSLWSYLVLYFADTPTRGVGVFPISVYGHENVIETYQTLCSRLSGGLRRIKQASCILWRYVRRKARYSIHTTPPDRYTDLLSLLHSSHLQNLEHYEKRQHPRIQTTSSRPIGHRRISLRAYDPPPIRTNATPYTTYH